MCDINKKTRKKSVIGYKAVYKEENKYISPFTKAIIKEGSTKRLKVRNPYTSEGWFYNEFMKKYNLVSIFAKKRDAVILAERLVGYNPKVLRIVLSGDIFTGTTKGITDGLSDNEITYAGNYIESIEEVKYKRK